MLVRQRRGDRRCPVLLANCRLKKNIFRKTKGGLSDSVTVIRPAMVSLINIQDANSFYTGGTNILFADGSVRLLSRSIDIGEFVALCTQGGGEIVDGD